MSKMRSPARRRRQKPGMTLSDLIRTCAARISVGKAATSSS
ncbi:MAG: hypothetical protein ACLSDQ_13770 [Adlercreutzia equolifaciens]